MVSRTSRVFMWPTANEAGEDFLNEHVAPLLRKHGLVPHTPAPGDDRNRMSNELRTADAVILDCSVEPGHIYHKLYELVKVHNNVLLCSRTALPRNVYAFHQCAPTHGHRKSNAELGAWLAETLPKVLDARYHDDGFWEMMLRSLKEQRDQLGRQTGLFVSYRGSQQACANSLRDKLAAAHKTPVRVVPRGQFAYETECMSRQRMWEVVALLEREIRVAPGVVVLLSPDYLDSFWTCSELLIIQYRRLQNGSAQNCWLVETADLEHEHPLRFGRQPGALDVPLLRAEERQEYARLLRQSDPGTVAPERSRPNPGFTGLFFGLVARLSGHASAPNDESWWHDLMVRCSRCAPKHRQSSLVSWTQHLSMEGYGYFLVPHAQVNPGARLRCACGATYTLKSHPEPRTYWVPGPLGRTWPESMNVIETQPLWLVDPA